MKPVCAGYSGRTAILELMVFNRALRQLVAKGCSSEELQTFATQNGMLEFRRSAMVKVAMGVTSTEEVLRELPTTVGPGYVRKLKRIDGTRSDRQVLSVRCV